MGSKPVAGLAGERTEGLHNGTENGSFRVNAAACLAGLREWVLHQLQLSPKGLTDKAAQQECGVRRALSTRPNWLHRFKSVLVSLYRALSEHTVGHKLREKKK